MSWTKESDCVGCEHCINCGRREGYYIAECDSCGTIEGNDTPIYLYDGQMLCEECLLENLIKDSEIVETEDETFIWDEEFFESEIEIFNQFSEVFELAKKEDEEWD